MSDEPFAVEADEDESPFALVGDWVLLAPISDRAVRVYALLRAHVNHARKDNEAWPSQEKLAAALGLSKPDDIGKSIKALEEIGAVRKKFRTGRKGRYTVYVVRLHAPAGYAGMRGTEDLHRPGAVEQLVEERVKRLPHRTHAAIEAAKVSTPDLGSPVWTTPDLGATPDQGVGHTPDQGGKQYEGELDEGAFKTHTALPRDALCDPKPPVVEFPDEIQVPADPDEAIADWSKRPKSQSKFSKLSGTAASMPARRLVTEFSSTLTYPLKGEIYAKWSAAVSKLMAEGVYPEEVLRQAMVECMAGGKPPAALYSFAAAVANRAPDRGRSLQEPELGTTGLKLQSAEARLREEMRAADAREAAGQLENSTPRAISR